MDHPELREAAEALKSVCDGAHEQDGTGFNGFDAPFARDLLSKGTWSPRQAQAMHKLLRKYRKQLAGFGIAYDALPVPSEVPAWQPSPAQQQVLQPHTYGGAQVAQIQLRPEPVAITHNVHEKYGLQFRVKFPSFDPKVKDAFRAACKTTIWEPETKIWIVPAKHSSELLEFAREQGWKWNDDALFEAMKLERDLKDAARIRDEATKASSASDSEFLKEWRSNKGHALFPYQRAGAEYLVKKERAILADSPGLGKTCQALAAIHATKGTPALIICPASVIMVWERHVAEWLPGCTVTVAPEAPRAGSRSIHITSYDRASRDYERLLSISWTTVVCDEHHLLKNRDAKRTQRICGAYDARSGKETPGLLQKAKYRYLLSGTPVPNKPVELIQPLLGIDRLRDLGGFAGYATRYCGWVKGVPGTINGAVMANLPELNQRLRATCWVRRLKEDVMKSLPPKFTDHIPIELSNISEYRRAERDVFEFLGKSHGEAEAIQRMTTLRGLAAKGKVKAAIEWIEENYMESESKLVLLGWHVEPLEAIAAYFGSKAVILTGQTSKEGREKAIDRFQNDESCLLFVGSRAAYEGITLTAASELAFLELPWNPGMVDQASDRIHRIGQTAESVSYHYLLAPETLDSDLADLIDEKRRIITAVQNGVAVTEGQMIGLLMRKLKEKKP